MFNICIKNLTGNTYDTHSKAIKTEIKIKRNMLLKDMTLFLLQLDMKQNNSAGK